MLAKIFSDYERLGKAQGVSDEEAKKEFSRAKVGQNIYVETSWSGSRGRILLIDRKNSDEISDYESLCVTSMRWYCLARL